MVQYRTLSSFFPFDMVLLFKVYLVTSLKMIHNLITRVYQPARLAQSVEHETLNLRVVGSSPTSGDLILFSLKLSNLHFMLLG